MLQPDQLTPQLHQPFHLLHHHLLLLLSNSLCSNLVLVTHLTIQLKIHLLISHMQPLNKVGSKWGYIFFTNYGNIFPSGSSPATYGQGPKLEVSPASPYSQPQAGGYQNYAAYKPQAPSYTPYYESIKAQTTSTFVTASQTISAIATGTTTYVPTYTLTTTADSGGSMVGYPSFTQTSYASAANAYYKQMKDTKTSTAGQVRHTHSK